MSKDLDIKYGQFVRALTRGTLKNEIKWFEIESKKTNYSLFMDPGQQLDHAYYSQDEKRYIIVYKASQLVQNQNIGEEYEQSNIYVVLTENSSTYKSAFKFYDFDFEDGDDLWVLYKTIQRGVSSADTYMDDIINKFGDKNDLGF